MPAEALASTDRFALIDAALRYHYHIKLGIPAHHITPYKEEWLEQALMRVPEQSGLDKVRHACRTAVSTAVL